MSIRKRFLLATFVALITLLLTVFHITNGIIDDIISRWTLQYADREVTHAVRRAVNPIRSDLAIINEIAADEQIITWANDPTDPELRNAGLEYLNRSRFKLNSSSYFIALKNNNSYYYNDLAGVFSGAEYQYQLSPEKNEDKWFYSTLKANKALNLNVDFDRGLEITNLWINRQIRNGDTVLGVVGTGFDIDEFLERYLSDSDPRFENFFIDKDGAIQLSNDRGLIVNAAISVSGDNKPLIFGYLPRAQDRESLQAALKQSEDLRIVDVEWFGRKVLLSITYIPDLEWYSVTAIDASTVLNRNDFFLLYAALGIFSIVFAAGVLVAVFWYIERPIQQIKQSVDRMFDPNSKKSKISIMPLEYQTLLSRIETFAYFDPLTGLLNRRGLMERCQNIQADGTEKYNFCSITVLDLDHFKKFNDAYGHGLGDQALINFSKEGQIAFNHCDDIIARFGGEEFIIVTFSQKKGECAKRLEDFLKTLRKTPLCKDKNGKELFITASAGIVTTTFTSFSECRLEDFIDLADEYLYSAKITRDCIKSFYISDIPKVHSNTDTPGTV